MNADTERNVKDILKDGYYFPHTALGEGGWPYLYRYGIDTWKTYLLYIYDQPDVITVIARDGETAIGYFKEAYTLDKVSYQIVEKTVTYRTLEEKTQ